MLQSKLFIIFFLITFSYASSNFSQSYKEKKLYPMGEKIYKKKCQEIDPLSYNTLQEMQTDIKKRQLCSFLNPSHLEALSHYLWDIKRRPVSQKIYQKLTTTKDEKCPVCGMFLYKYPTWICRINYVNASFAFDGIKDMMKYYFQHKEGINELLVQDYYTQKTLDARKAFFVLGSDVYGPMGNELIAFSDKKSAERFWIDHKGKELLSFDELTPQKVYQLDE